MAVSLPPDPPLRCPTCIGRDHHWRQCKNVCHWCGDLHWNETQQESNICFAHPTKYNQDEFDDEGKAILKRARVNDLEFVRNGIMYEVQDLISAGEIDQQDLLTVIDKRMRQHVNDDMENLVNLGVVRYHAFARLIQERIREYVREVKGVETRNSTDEQKAQPSFVPK